MKRIAYDQWNEKNRVSVPSWDKIVRGFNARRGTKRKIPLLCDENIEIELVRELSALKYFKVHSMQSGADDTTLWMHAIQKKRIIVTSDRGDYWNDKKFPLQFSPGIVILSGKNASDKLVSMVRAMKNFDIIHNVNLVGLEYLFGKKIRASRDRITVKFYDNGRCVEFES